MTIVFTGVSRHLIVVTVDGVETWVIEDGQREYQGDVLKALPFPGVGCVATWGERTSNKVFSFLRMQEVAPETHSVEDLRDIVSEYLRSEYRPGDHGLGEVGFHITGYDRTNRPRFFYEVWGWHRPLKETQTQPEYISGGYDLKGEEVRMVYNGRSEIAERVINALIEEIGAHPGEVLLWPDRPHDLTRLGDLIARFASELTPEVGPPFTTYLISRTNQVEYIRNQDRCPIALDEVEDRLKRMGFTWNPLA